MFVRGQLAFGLMLVKGLNQTDLADHDLESS